MDYAVIRLGGRQFKVQEGTKIKIERQQELNADVVLVSLNGEVVVGTPVLTDYTVQLEKLEDTRDRKIRIGRFRAKSRYRKVKGHKQPISIIEVKGIFKGAKKVEVAKEQPIVKEKPIKAEKAEKPVKTEKVEKKVVAKASPKKEAKPVKVKVKEAVESPKKRGRPKKVQE